MIKWHLKKTHTKLLLLGLAFWSIGDIATTWAGLNIGIPEGNPVFSWLTLETFLAGILVKAVAVVFLAFVINRLARMEHIKAHWIEKKFGRVSSKLCIGYILVLGFFVTVSNLALVLLGAGMQ